jgi:hypothetical protein
MCEAQYGIPFSTSAPGAPQKKKFFAPGRPCGQRQQVLVNSRSDLCVDVRGGFAAPLCTGPERRRTGPFFRTAGCGF